MNSALVKSAGLTALETEAGCKPRGRGSVANLPVSSVFRDEMLGLDLIGSGCLDSKITRCGGVRCVDQSWCAGGVLCRRYKLPRGAARLTCA